MGMAGRLWILTVPRAASSTDILATDAGSGASTDSHEIVGAEHRVLVEHLHAERLDLPVHLLHPLRPSFDGRRPFLRNLAQEHKHHVYPLEFEPG